MFDGATDLLKKIPSPITDEEYRNRQSKIYNNLDYGDLLIICSRPIAIRTNDVSYPYRTISDLHYLVGWTEPQSVMIAHYNNEKKSWLIVFMM